MTIKDSKYVKIYSVNPLYLIFNKVNGYFEEISGNKYLTLVPTNENIVYKNIWLGNTMVSKYVEHKVRRI